MEWKRGDYVISTDPERLDLPLVYRFLSEDAYWSPGVPLDVVERALANSIVFGLYRVSGQGWEQAGLARIVSDRATFAWLCDVFVLPEHRGEGLGKWLMECVKSHPDLQGLRRWMLATRDAHGLYAQHGFRPLKAPELFMERHDPDVYQRGKR